MKISIFGTGYVGLVTGACLADLGNEVLCCDIDAEKMNKLQNGVIPIYEPGLKEVVERNQREKRIFFTTDAKEAVEFGFLIFIAVGTPSAKNGDVDLKYVETVAKTIGVNLNSDSKIIVDKSTVPVGTAEHVRSLIQGELDQRCKKFTFGIASNPEFLKEGTAIDDFMKPDRIVVGTDSEWVAERVKELYNPLVKSGHPIFIVNLASAEMSKYASNAFLATKISFMNEISAICDWANADVEDVRKIMSSDKRIGNQFLYPGIGYGGSCFPKDVLGFISIANNFGCWSRITRAVDTANKEQRRYFIRKIKYEIKDLKGKTFAIWGLSFKPNTDDMREAPSVTVIKALLKGKAIVKVYDPVAMEEAKKIFGNKVSYEKDKYDCLKDADALVIITEWTQFKAPDFERMKGLMKTPIIFDGRNIYSLDQMEKTGFTYVSIGRKTIIS